MPRIKQLSAGRLRTSLLMLAAIGLASVAPNVAQAGAYSVFTINMAQLNYKTPITYSKIIRSGLTQDVFKSADACIASVKSRVANNKNYGNDFETFLIIYTDRYPTGPTGSNDSGTCTLAHVNSLSYGNWAGWTIYWCPARNNGYFQNTPYPQFKAYGRQSTRAANAKPVTLDAPAGNATNTPAAAPAGSNDGRVSQSQPGRPTPGGGVSSMGRDILVGQIEAQRFKAMRPVAWTAIVVSDGWSGRNGVGRRGGSGSSSQQVRQKSATETSLVAC